MIEDDQYASATKPLFDNRSSRSTQAGRSIHSLAAFLQECWRREIRVPSIKQVYARPFESH
jgi:hypothetical protein